MSTDGEYDDDSGIGGARRNRIDSSAGGDDDDSNRNADDAYFGYIPTNKSSVHDSTGHDDLLEDDDMIHDYVDRSNNDDDDEEDDNELTLKQVVDRGCKYLDIGTAVLPGPLFTADVEDYDGSEELRDAVKSMPETHYARIIRKEFNAIVIEHHLKWSPLLSIDVHPPTTSSTKQKPQQQHYSLNRSTSSTVEQQPQQSSLQATSHTNTSNNNNTTTTNSGSSTTEQPRLGRYDFYYADSIVDWGLAKGIRKIKGHVLVWHVTTPKLLEDLEPSRVREELQRHIYTVMGHFRGRISTWDVVNEALAPDGTLAENVFLRKLGPSYIEDCFRWAHDADPTAILLYNDNKVEGYGTKKANGFYELLADLKAKRVPVHGCGLQAHWNAAGTGLNRPPTPRMLKKQIRRLGKLGLTVNISEMDVRVSKLQPTELRDIAQRQVYYDLIAAAISEPAVDGIWLWGFTDRHTWVSNFYYDDEPLLFDEYYQRKPAYYGLRDALTTLTPGHVICGDYYSSSNTTCSSIQHTAQRTSSILPSHPTIPIESDADDNGNTWGHLWIQPEPEVDLLDDGGVVGGGGDTRPDWEQDEEPLPDDEPGMISNNDDTNNSNDLLLLQKQSSSKALSPKGAKMILNMNGTTTTNTGDSNNNHTDDPLLLVGETTDDDDDDIIISDNNHDRIEDDDDILLAPTGSSDALPSIS